MLHLLGREQRGTRFPSVAEFNWMRRASKVVHRDNAPTESTAISPMALTPASRCTGDRKKKTFLHSTGSFPQKRHTRCISIPRRSHIEIRKNSMYLLFNSRRSSTLADHTQALWREDGDASNDRGGGTNKGNLHRRSEHHADRQRSTSAKQACQRHARRSPREAAREEDTTGKPHRERGDREAHRKISSPGP